MATNSANEIISMTEQWFAKAPALPANAKEVIVRFTPIIVLVFGVLGILGAISGLGLLTAFSPVAVFGGARFMGSYATGFIAALIWLVSAILMLMAYPGTKARKLSGWNLLFWSEVVSLVGSLISGSLLSGIIGAVITFYLLFQIKASYK